MMIPGGNVRVREQHPGEEERLTIGTDGGGVQEMHGSHRGLVNWSAAAARWTKRRAKREVSMQMQEEKQEHTWQGVGMNEVLFSRIVPEGTWPAWYLSQTLQGMEWGREHEDKSGRTSMIGEGGHGSGASLERCEREQCGPSMGIVRSLRHNEGARDILRRLINPGGKNIVRKQALGECGRLTEVDGRGGGKRLRASCQKLGRKQIKNKFDQRNCITVFPWRAGSEPTDVAHNRRTEERLKTDGLHETITGKTGSMKESIPRSNVKERSCRHKAKCRSKNLKRIKRRQGYAPLVTADASQTSRDRSHQLTQVPCFLGYSSGWLTATDDFVYAVTWPP
jgi:hypothetical protein